VQGVISAANIISKQNFTELANCSLMALLIRTQNMMRGGQIKEVCK
jgi:hypothetical protein